MIKNLLATAVLAGLSFGAAASTTVTLDVMSIFGNTDGAYSVKFVSENDFVTETNWIDSQVNQNGLVTINVNYMTNCDEYTAYIYNLDGMIVLTGTADNCPMFESYYMPALQTLVVNGQTIPNSVQDSDYVTLSFQKNPEGTTYKTADFVYDELLGFVLTNGTTLPAGFNTQLDLTNVAAIVMKDGVAVDTFTVDGRQELIPMGSGEQPEITPIWSIDYEAVATVLLNRGVNLELGVSYFVEVMIDSGIPMYGAVYDVITCYSFTGTTFVHDPTASCWAGGSYEVEQIMKADLDAISITVGNNTIHADQEDILN